MALSAEAAKSLDLLVTGPGDPVKVPRETPVLPIEKDGSPAEVPVFSLPEAVAFALRNNPRLRVAREEIVRAQGQEQVAFAPFLPFVDLFSRIGAVNPKLGPGAPGPVGGIVPSGDGSHEFIQADLEVQWMVWDFGRTSGHYQQAVARERIAELQLTRANQTVAFDVASDYLGVLLAQAARRAREQAIRSAEAILEDARVRRQAGTADRDEVLRAEVQLSETQEALVLAHQAEFEALARLNHTLGRNAGLPLRVLDWTARPSFDRSLADCLETAAGQRREVAVAREAVAVARGGAEAATGDFYPRIYVRLGGGDVGGEGVRTGFQEGASIHLDQQLFGGGRRLGERQSAEAEVRAAVARAQNVLDDISLEVNLAYRGVTATRERIPLAETAIIQARENLRLVRVKYKNGNATPTDVVDAETTLTRSEQREYSAVYDYLAALARLEYAMGTTPGCLLEGPKKEGPVGELPPPKPVPQDGDKGK
jgi:outer membrane protein TolC